MISGSTGFIGKSLLIRLQKKGHEIVRLVRGHVSSDVGDEIGWDPDQGIAIKEQFEGFDVVLHLAGENIGSHRWTLTQKRNILFSRTVSTFFLSQILRTAEKPPSVFLSPSAVGYYGDSGDKKLTEESPPGQGFLARVCVEWERASSALASRGTRTLHPRFGTVLGPGGGILEKLLLPYRLGLGGRLGSGKQWISWISLEDLLSGIEFAIASKTLEGAFNLVSPHPVRQEVFAKVLAKELHRPTFLPFPAALLRLGLGCERAEELLLASTKVYPTKLVEMGFAFLYPTLDSALQAALI